MHIKKNVNTLMAYELLKILKKNKKKIAEKIKKDTNKKLKDALAEVNSSINILNYAILQYAKIKTNYTAFKLQNSIGKIFFEPVGCVAFITPWNYPLLTIFERLPFALLAGCNIILKPSEFTPNFNNLLKKILHKNKILNNQIKVLLSKDNKEGKLLTYDKNVDMISFVGSAKTAKNIVRQTSYSLKKISLELGGKNTAIILDKDFNVNFIDNIIFGIFENSGRACVAISKILVNEKIYDDFLQYLQKRIIKKFLNKNIYERKILKFEKNKIKDTIKFLDKKISFKNRLYLSKNKKNFCLLISDKYSKYDKILDEEFFFPIVSCQSFKNEKQLIEKANNSKYGLACYIFSKNIKKSKQIVKNLDFGRIWINSGPTNWNPALPVGGKKMSGKSFDMGDKGFFNYLIPKSIYHRRNIK